MNGVNSGQISGNFIGIDITGVLGNDPITGASLVGYWGLRVQSCNNVTVGGVNPADSNVISSSAGDGGNIGCLATCNNILIERNYIGTDKTGKISLNQSLHGIRFFAAGGTPVGNVIQNNVVAGAGIGINIANPVALINNNKIGTDASGTTVLGNNGPGILMSNEGAQDPAPVVQNNVVSGNTYGIQLGRNIEGTSPVLHCSIQGNKIGTDASGTQVLGNQHDGILVTLMTDTIIGVNPSSPNIAQHNIIAGNEGNGIFITNPADTTLIKGNIIGANISGSLAKDSNGNSFGNKVNGVCIGIDQGGTTSPTTVGGTTQLETNYIVNNGQDGITIQSFSESNIIEGNSIGVGIGNKKLGNQGNGVTIICSSNNIIGS